MLPYQHNELLTSGSSFCSAARNALSNRRSACRWFPISACTSAASTTAPAHVIGGSLSSCPKNCFHSAFVRFLPVTWHARDNQVGMLKSHTMTLPSESLDANHFPLESKATPVTIAE